MSHLILPEQRALLRASLTQRQQALDEQWRAQLGPSGRVEHTHEVLQEDGDDAAQRAGDREVDMARSDHLTQAIGAVSAALHRIDRADYGQCAGCHDPISFERLKLEPWALRCVSCESRREAAPQAAQAST